MKKSFSPLRERLGEGKIEVWCLEIGNFVPVKRLVITNVQIDRFFLLSRAALDAYRYFGLGRGYRLGGGSPGGLGSGLVSGFRSRLVGWLGGWLVGGFGSGLVGRFGGGLGGWFGSGLGSGLRGCPLSCLGGWLLDWLGASSLYEFRMS
jgi:hypothetical protein